MKSLTQFLILLLFTLSLEAQSNLQLHNVSTIPLLCDTDLVVTKRFATSIPISFYMEGMYDECKINEIKWKLQTLLLTDLDMTQISALEIRIESSGKIAIIPKGNINEALTEKIRAYLSTYDWDYLHEIMTAEIIIRFDSQA